MHSSAPRRLQRPPARFPDRPGSVWDRRAVSRLERLVERLVERLEERLEERLVERLEERLVERLVERLASLLASPLASPQASPQASSLAPLRARSHRQARACAAPTSVRWQ